MASIFLSLPESGLTVNVSVLNQSTEVQDFSGLANEIGSSKGYVYTFTEAANTDYVYIATITGYDTLTGAIFRDTAGGGGATPAQIWEYADRTLTQSIGGGGSFNMSGVTGSINNLTKLVREESDKIREHVTAENNDTKSHIDIAKGDINNTIESIEIPEIPETDLSSITEGIGILKQRFTTLQKWLKEEQKKEMQEKDKENEGKMIELQSKIDEMEEAFEEMQNLSSSEVQEKQKLIDEMELTAKEIIKGLEEEKVVNKEATEKEIKEKLISSLSE